MTEEAGPVEPLASIKRPGVAPGIATLFENRLPELLQGEVEDAKSVEFESVVGGSPAFDALVASTSEPFIYVVIDGELHLGSPVVRHQRIFHSVLAQGRPVQAAGEVSLVCAGEFRHVLSINNSSGHYAPDERSISVAVSHFRSAGYEVSEGAIESYNGRY